MKISMAQCVQTNELKRGLRPAGELTGARFACLSASRRAFVRFCSGREGGALVEMAIVLPLFLMVMTGIFTAGIAMNNFQVLTNAVNIGGTQLQQLRNMSAASDPCSAVGSAVTAAAPYLTPSGTNGIQLTVTLDNGGYTQALPPLQASPVQSGSSYLLQATSATVTATYPCNLTIYGVNYAPGCKLHASVTELIQ